MLVAQRGVTTFGQALRMARADQTQRGIADQLTRRGFPITMQGVGAWERDESPPPPPVVFELERLLELPPGALSQHLGYLPVSARDIVTARDAIAADTSLDAQGRRSVLAVYDSFRKK